MRIRDLTVPLLLLLAAPPLGCSSDAPPAGGPDASGGGGGAAGAGGGVDLGPNELPCDVRAVVEEVCSSCHASPVAAGAPTPLLARHDFLAPHPGSGKTVGEQSLERMKSAMAPMPPSSEPPMSAGQMAVFEQWIAAGMPPGTCGSIPAKPAETTCASGKLWDPNATSTAQMNPGQACRACHKTQASDFNYFFMGTVFPAFHEKDLCMSPPPPGAKVEILDATGKVTMTLTPNAAGNFMSSAVAAGVPVPYTARLVANGLTRSMTGPQKDGDCNKCHTEQGAEGAPGRLVWPRDYDAPPTPTAPVLVDLIPMGDALHVMWTASGCDKILLFRNEDGGAFSLVYTLGGSTTEQHDDGAYSPSTVYCYRAQCKAGGVASADSNELCGSP
ncbi:hypothetical protein [Polyangium aurulentum]|uniref:hypothetical protein n=1 Tax=Polyangium aurulentum TaxID=2567896 RepID=UPI0010ADB961|nr:hypothetical protein [Polyangium aurulentum]UQA58382.1 hypothetical protein E8A73_045250 [Polyangium aurulentum]